MGHFAFCVTAIVVATGLGSKLAYLPVPPGGVVHPLRALNDTSTGYPFLPEWEANLTDGPPGCNSASTGHWTWRVSGLGCNMVRLLSAYEYWVYGWGWNNLAIILEEHFDGIECSTRAAGRDVHGWDCIFRPMPHICTFRTLEEYSTFLTAQGATAQTLEASLEVNNYHAWHDPRPKKPYPGFVKALHPSAMESRTMTARHIWNHFQPWVEEDLRTLTSCSPAEVRDGPYVGLHIRRGDKLAHEATLTPAEDYLNVTVTELLGHYQKCTDDTELFCEEGTMLLPEDIRGVHVASDDTRVADEIRNLVHDYLPNVRPAHVVYTADGKDYLAMVYLLHDIDRLKNASIFVGTFTSNLGRFIATLRANTASFGAEKDHKRWKAN